MKDLFKRSLSAVVFLIIMIGASLLGHLVFSLVFLPITIIGLYEYYKLLSSETVRPARIISIILGGIIYALIAFGTPYLSSNYTFLFSFVLLLPLFFIELWRNKRNPLLNIAVSISGIFYVSFPLAMLSNFFLHSTSETNGYPLVLGYLFILWLNDTGAYFVGSAMGKNRLFERHSPKKSWEGSIGGGLFAVLMAYGNSLLFPELEFWKWIIIAIIVIFAGTLGDLVESMLKRSVGVKDSGNIMPGHGGILDRFDAVLLSAPFVYIVLLLI